MSPSPPQPADLAEVRPQTRAECPPRDEGGRRVCPWLGCRHHLGLSFGKRRGRSRRRDPRVRLHPALGPERDDVEALAEALGGSPCALDHAEEGGLTLKEVGARLGVTRERARQIEEVALAKLREGIGPDLSAELIDGLRDARAPAASWFDLQDNRAGASAGREISETLRERRKRSSAPKGWGSIRHKLEHVEEQRAAAAERRAQYQAEAREEKTVRDHLRVARAEEQGQQPEREQTLEERIETLKATQHILARSMAEKYAEAQREKLEAVAPHQRTHADRVALAAARLKIGAADALELAGGDRHADADKQAMASALRGEGYPRAVEMRARLVELLGDRVDPPAALPAPVRGPEPEETNTTPAPAPTPGVLDPAAWRLVADVARRPAEKMARELARRDLPGHLVDLLRRLEDGPRLVDARLAAELADAVAGIARHYGATPGDGWALLRVQGVGL